MSCLEGGSKLHDAGLRSTHFGWEMAPIHSIRILPMWDVAPDPGEEAPFSSVTQWTWENYGI